MSNQDLPRCFGSQFDRQAPECVGGHDPAYWEDGSHIRPACDYVNQCSVRTQASKHGQVIPVTSLTRPNLPPTTTTWHKPTPTYQPQQYYSPVPAPQQQLIGMAQSVAVNYGIPQYLTMREPVTSGGFAKRMGFEVLRSIGKSIGHTISHFFDVEPLGRHEPVDNSNGQGKPGQ